MSKKTDVEDTRRAWLWHASCPEGKIFTGAEIDKKEKEGWVDSPTKIKRKSTAE